MLYEHILFEVVTIFMSLQDHCIFPESEFSEFIELICLHEFNLYLFAFICADVFAHIEYNRSKIFDCFIRYSSTRCMIFLDIRIIK